MPRRWFTSKGAAERLFLCLLLLLPVAHVRAKTGGNDCPAQHFSESTRIGSITDGDTLRLADGRKLRLIGVNAPEMAHAGRPAEAYSRQAKAALQQLFNTDKSIRLIYGVEDKDRYGRLLAHAFLADGRNAQSQLLSQGLAYSIAIPPNTRLADCYRRQEKIARCRHVGLWQNPALVSTDELEGHEKGFVLVAGKLQSIQVNKKGIWLNIDDLLTVGIRPDERELFDLNALQTMLGQPVVVRGWLNRSRNKKYKNPFYIRLRHPSSLQSRQQFGCS